MTLNDDPVSGMVVIASQRSVSETMARLEALLKEKGVLVFAHIDFAADAARAGLSLRPEQLLIFGKPQGGTPLMVDRPSVGLDLPFKALAWEDERGLTWLGFNDPQYIVQRHGVDAALAKNLAAIVPLVEAAAHA